MNAQIIFSDAPYRNKHSLKISHPYIEKRVFYITESSFGLAPFFYRRPYFCNRDSYNVDTCQAHVFGADKASAKIWYCVPRGCLFYRPEHNFFGHPSVNGLQLTQVCPKFQDLHTICIGREVTDKILKVTVNFWYWNFFGSKIT